MNKPPMVSVIMVTYNHEKFIDEAVMGVVNQNTTFPIQLVIGEDSSKDKTREKCEYYANQYPEIVKLLPSPHNYGIPDNFIRTFQECDGKYISILDGDDYFIDPNKLQDDVDFLEQNNTYGLVYSDVKVMSFDGKDLDYTHDLIRKRYTSGECFFDLLKGNFVNSCTATFRKDLLQLENDPEKYWYIFDFWHWLHISMESKVQFRDKKTAVYRKHAGGVSNQKTVLYNRKKWYFISYDILTKFAQVNRKPLSASERKLIFRKLLSLLYRKHGSIPMKAKILKILHRYVPDFSGMRDILASKLGLRQQEISQ